MCTAYLMRMCSVNFRESAVTSLVADGMVVISQLQGISSIFDSKVFFVRLVMS